MKKYQIKIKLLCSVLLIACLTIPAKAQAPSVYNLQVTADETNIIAEALQDQPYKKVFMLMGKLRQQVIEQSQPKSAAAPVLPKPAETPEKPDASPQAQ